MATLFGEITIVDNGGTRAAIRSSKSNLAARRCSQQPSIHPPRRTKPVAHLQSAFFVLCTLYSTDRTALN